MRHLRMFGPTLLATLALVSCAATTASAEEPGILPFLGTKSATVELKLAEATEVKLATAAGEVKCAKLDPTTASATGLHILLFNEVDLMLLECELIKGGNKFKCRSETLKAEKDPLGTILALVDFHLVDLLRELTNLAPGVVVIILDQDTKEQGELRFKCATPTFFLKGIAKGLVLASLVKDVTSTEIDFPTTNPCDEADKLCLKYETKALELLLNLGVEFEAATLTLKLPLTSSVEVLFAD